MLLDAEGEEAGRISGSPADGCYPFETWLAGEVVRDPLWFVSAQPMNLEAGVYRFGVTVSVDESSSPERVDDGFVLLGAVEFLVEKEE